MFLENDFPQPGHHLGCHGLAIDCEESRRYMLSLEEVNTLGCTSRGELYSSPVGEVATASVRLRAHGFVPGNFGPRVYVR